MRDIAARMGGPDVTEILREQNAQLMKDIAARTGGPDVTQDAEGTERRTAKGDFEEIRRS